MYMYTRNFLFTVYCCFLLTACGYGREEDKEVARQEEIQELRQEMEQYRSRLDSLKAQVRERQSGTEAAAEAEPAEENVYQIMMAELQRAEATYQVWEEELIPETESRSHEEVMQHYDQKEQRAEVVRQEMLSAIQYVESELQE